MKASLVSISALIVSASAGVDLTYGHDEDLHSFVTRPELRAPRFEVQTYPSDDGNLTRGYWFTAPYARISQEKHAALYYQACQTGPAIYDNDGELVWSGACQFRNQNAHDFRMWTFNGTLYLSTILYTYAGIGDKSGHGIIMDSSYNVVRNITAPPELTVWNMHELHLSDEGRKAIFMTWNARLGDISSMKLEGVKAGWVGDIGFTERDLVTEKSVFEWWAAGSGEIDYSESKVPVVNVQGPWPRAWDWIHANSIDKNTEGDYIFSGRFTDTIYKVCGSTGKVLWRLGGDKSTFQQDFAFSRQHDARTLSINSTHELITVFDNAADEQSQIAEHSSAKLISLDRTSHTATLLSSIPRPDGNLTRLRGNYQSLDNGNHFICWSENSYFSEHSPDGTLLMQAKFASRRFSTYRGYKFDFVGIPNGPPDVVAIAHGTSPRKASTAIHVSWNGATEVFSWRFREAASKLHLGDKRKTGFETLFYADDVFSTIFVEAIDQAGQVIGTSSMIDVQMPAWGDNDFGVQSPDLPSFYSTTSGTDSHHTDWPAADHNRNPRELFGLTDRLWFLLLAMAVFVCVLVGKCGLKSHLKIIVGLFRKGRTCSL